MTGRTIRALLSAAALASSSPVHAAGLTSANKVIALVQAQGCDPAQLGQRLDAAGKAMARDRRTSRVVIDWPADAERNLDLMGRPSPFAAAVEISAGRSAVTRLARRLEHALGTDCRAGIYLVHERRLLAMPRTWRLGQPSPASKTLVTLNRKQGLSLEAFDREWAVAHAQLALAWRAARGGSGHYVQNLVLGRVGGNAPPLDGIGESEGPAVPGPEEREARVKTAAHARTFQDVENSTMVIVREVILKD